MNPLDMGCKCGCGRSEYNTSILRIAMKIGQEWEARSMTPAGTCPPLLCITSGYRCMYYDWKINPDLNSTRQHTRGVAIDLARIDGGSFLDKEIEWIKERALHYGATGVGLYNRSIHIDWREERFITNPKMINGRKVQLWDMRK